MADARAAALAALLHVDENEGFSNLVLDKTLAQFALEPRDAALASAIFYGVLERRLTLDYYIGQFASIPIRKMSPQVREILRIGAYQILYLEKVPPSAAVNVAVELAKQNRAVKASGFINAVLRNLLRNLEKLHLPEQEADPVHFLSLKYSCPEWLILLWQKAYGQQCTADLLDSLSEHPPIYVRLNNTKGDEEYLLRRLMEENVKAEAITWVPWAAKVEVAGSISSLGAFQEGLFHVQDLSSQLCAAFLGAKPGERVVDVCAAPGGKTFTIAEQMQNTGEVLAFDQYKGKVRLIRDGASRLGLTCVRADLRDAQKPTKPLEPADRVLCDAPCSGLGILRRKPEIRYKLPCTLDSLQDLQYGILSKTSELVKSGGVLLYSTCTLNPAENGEVARRFLKEHAEFVPRALSAPLGLQHAIEEPENEWTFLPHAHGTDGFFVASFQRR